MNLQQTTNYKGLSIVRLNVLRASGGVINETHFDDRNTGKHVNLSRWFNGIKVNCMKLKDAKGLVDFAIAEELKDMDEKMKLWGEESAAQQLKEKRAKMQEESILAEIDERNV